MQRAELSAVKQNCIEKLGNIDDKTSSYYRDNTLALE